MKMSNYPLLKILIPFVSGIITAYFCQFPYPMCRIWFAITLALWLVSCIFTPVKTYKWQWVKTLTLSAAYFFAGVGAMNFRFSSHLTPAQRRLMAESRDWLCRVEDFPVVRAKTVKLVARIQRAGTGEAVGAKVVLYVQRSPEADAIEYGDILLAHARLEEVAPPQNPDAFDNRLHLGRKGIHHSGFVHDGFWLPAGNRPRNPLKALAHRIQGRLAAAFATSGLSGEEYDIAKAILLGDDDTMEPELKASYAAAGVSHILCVSGMHVGVIFMILNFLLKPLGLFRRTRWLKSLTILLLIWLYAHITGLSPSVTRSATMFTFVTIGQGIRRNTNVFHSLLASLWVLLAVNPTLLFELGFQLSYIAVTGIVLLQPLLGAAYTCKTRAGSYFWELATVSVAAQIATAPISIHHFGRFPNYFLLTNMTVITLSFVVMMSGVGLWCVAWAPRLGGWAAWLLTHEIRLMNGIVTFVERLPGAVTENLFFSVPQVWLLYIIIIWVYVAVRHRSRRAAWAAYLALALLSGTFLSRKVELLRQEEVTVYQTPRSCAVAFCHQQRCVFFSDSITGADDGAFRHAAANHLRRQHAACTFVPIDTATYSCPFLCKRGPLVRFNRQTYYLLRRREKTWPVTEPLEVDVLLLQHNPVQPPEEVARAVRFKEVVADASNTPYCVRRWRDWCRQYRIPFRDAP